MTQVSNDKPFDVIYSFGYYPILGYLLEAYAVPLLNNGQLSLAHQQVHKLTAEYYGIQGEEKEAIIALDNTDPKNLFKKSLCELSYLINIFLVFNLSSLFAVK